MKQKIASFGTKGESHNKILQRIYDMAVKTQLREFLMSSENTISIEETRKETEKLWPMSKDFLKPVDCSAFLSGKSHDTSTTYRLYEFINISSSLT